SNRASAMDFDKFWKCLIEELGTEKAYTDEALSGASWAMAEIGAMLNRHNIRIEDIPVEPQDRARLVARIIDGTISHKIAKDVFDAMWAGEGEADAIIEKRGLKQISDADAIERIIDAVLGANPAIVAEYKSGKQKAF